MQFIWNVIKIWVFLVFGNILFNVLKKWQIFLKIKIYLPLMHKRTKDIKINAHHHVVKKISIF